MKKEKSRKIGTEWVFLTTMVVVYLIVGLTDFGLLLRVLTSFKKILYHILPIIPLIFGLIFVTNLFLDPKRIRRYLGSESGLKGYIISIIGGILSTGPIYMWYPLLKELKEKGMRTSFVAIFLYNRAVKIPLLPIMIFYFGFPFVIILTVLMTIFSVVNGILVEKLI